MPPETRRESLYEDPKGRNKIYEYMVKIRYEYLLSIADCLGLDAARVKHTRNQGKSQMYLITFKRDDLQEP